MAWRGRGSSYVLGMNVQNVGTEECALAKDGLQARVRRALGAVEQLRLDGSEGIFAVASVLGQVGVLHQRA